MIDYYAVPLFQRCSNYATGVNNDPYLEVTILHGNIWMNLRTASSNKLFGPI